MRREESSIIKMETRSSSRKRRDSDAESVCSVASSMASAASEPIISRSRSTTPFTLRSQCPRHGSECPEGHGISFRNRLSPSPKRSNKKSPKKLIYEDTRNIRKNLLLNLKPSFQNGNGKSPSAVTPPLKIVTKTSDYSSAEEEVVNVDKMRTVGTPANSQSHVLTPLKRSAEKTDFTYAKSYSYRTEVTPERIITMPNMTRRSIERNAFVGDGYTSPDLKLTSQKVLFHSRTTFTSNAKPSGVHASYGTDGTDYESDCETEEHLSSSYHLKVPPSGGVVTKASFFSRRAYSWIKEVIFRISWWIYLITCYSLLLDTHILQSRGITKLRNFCRQQKRNTRLFILLFLLLPLCLFAGGLLYSALHAFNTHLPDNPPNPSIVNPIFPEDLSQPPATPPIIHSPSDTTSKLLAESAKEIFRDELKISRDATLTLQEKMIDFDSRMASLHSTLDALKGQLLAVTKVENKDSCSDSTSEVLMTAVDAKLVALATQLSQEAKLESQNLDTAINQLKAVIQEELKELKEWKRVVDDRGDTLAGELSDMRNHFENRETVILNQVTLEIEKAIAKWENDSKAGWFNEMKQQLVTEISNQIKVLDAKSGRGLNQDEVNRLIHSALGIYDSDKTGLADYALEPAGGVVLSTRCTETFSSHRPRLSVWGFSLWSEPNNPRVVIQPGIVPGQCWSFRGFDGYLVLQLSRRITPTAFTLEHIPKTLAPDGQIDSAPRNFTVFGLSRESDTAGVQLGQYTYDNVGEPLQTFQVQERNPGYFHIVELRIHSNYGNLNYTCLYRFRVHGHIA